MQGFTPIDVFAWHQPNLWLQEPFRPVLNLFDGDRSRAVRNVISFASRSLEGGQHAYMLPSAD
jgi:hypothetical protein